jgi:hypothetical protein
VTTGSHRLAHIYAISIPATVVDLVAVRTSPMWADPHKTTSSIDSKDVVESMFSMIYPKYGDLFREQVRGTDEVP